MSHAARGTAPVQNLCRALSKLKSQSQDPHVTPAIQGMKPLNVSNLQ
jgi:hypothetical protein